jgi:methyl-accepting chemotaxis protein
MNRLIASLPIRVKILSGFALILSGMAIISVLTLISLSSVKESVNDVVNTRQPTVILSKELAVNLQQAAASLGFFLLSQEQEHKFAFQAAMASAGKSINRLKSLSTVQDDNKTAQMVSGIDSDMKRFKSLETRLFESASAYSKNFPAIAFANENINPTNRVLLQLTSQMLLSEMDEDATPDRKRLLSEIADLRYSWSNVMNGIRGYLAFRSDVAIKDMELYIDRAENLLAKIGKRGDSLTFEQQEALEQFSNELTGFKSNYRKMIEIHSSDMWRTDSWLVRSEVGPLFQSINKRAATS